MQWLAVEELGFDPDAVVPVPPGAEAMSPTGEGMGGGMGDTSEIRGYVWHCHNLDHADHDMMQRIRVQP